MSAFNPAEAAEQFYEEKSLEDTDVSLDEVIEDFEVYADYDLPESQIRRTVERDLEVDTMDGDSAKSPSGVGSGPVEVTLDKVPGMDGGAAVTAEVTVTTVYEVSSDKIRQKGRVADDTNSVEFIEFPGTDDPKSMLEENQSYRLENALINEDEYQGEVSYTLVLNESSTVEKLDKGVDTTADIIAPVVQVTDKSGLVFRDTDTNQTVDNKRAAENIEEDLRAIVRVDNGADVKTLNFQREQTENLMSALGDEYTLDTAKGRAKEAMDNEVVGRDVRERVVFTYLNATAVPLEEDRFLVEDFSLLQPDPKQEARRTLSEFEGTEVGPMSVSEDVEAPTSLGAAGDAGNASNRHPARRVFVQEFLDADFQQKAGGERLSPKMTLLPTGEWANRVFVAGTLTTVEQDREKDQWQGSITDPTGTFTVFGHPEYSEQTNNFLRTNRDNTPMHVGMIGKIDVSDGGSVYLQPESMEEIDPTSYGLWINETAKNTRQRVLNAAEAVQEGASDGAAVDAVTIYDTPPVDYFDTAREALEFYAEE